jgi:hypothetical protein
MSALQSGILSILFQHDRRHVLFYLVLLELGLALRERLQWFDLAHLDLLADELDVDLLDFEIRPRKLAPTSEAIGLIAAGVWGEGPDERWKWRERLVGNLPAVSEEAREELLRQVSRLAFVKDARWAK